MSIGHDKNPPGVHLRRRTERLSLASPAASSAEESDSRKLLQQLQVHQIELEMQNEELRLARIEIEKGLQQYTDLYDFAPISYFTLTNNGSIHQVNLAGAALLRLNRETLTGRSMARFFAGPDLSTFTSFLHSVRQNDTREICELHLQGSESTRRFLHIEGAVSIDGESCNLAVTDITENKRTEELLHNKNLLLEEATIAANKANQAKSDFLSSMSHELRTPLNAVLGFAQLLENSKPVPTATQKNSIQQIIKAGWYLLHLINEILDLAMIESGKVKLSTAKVSLNEVLHECEAMISMQAVQKGIQLLFPCFDHQLHINADYVRFKQIMLNLLSNALKYNRKNGTITVQCSLKQNNKVRISIHDTGEGLSTEQIALLFQPFNRLGRSGGVDAGTGIGLVVTKHLTELMGGIIGVASTPGEGCEFWVEFDAYSKAELLNDAPSQPQTDAQLWILNNDKPRQHTLLYIEDNRANLELVEQIVMLRDDLKLLTAPDAESGITLAQKHLPNVNLMDINLPGISGYDALKILRRNPVTTRIPVMALSANAIPSDIIIGMKSGFFGYLTKPFNINELMIALSVALTYAAETSQTNQDITL